MSIQLDRQCQTHGDDGVIDQYTHSCLIPYRRCVTDHDANGFLSQSLHNLQSWQSESGVTEFSYTAAATCCRKNHCFKIFSVEMSAGLLLADVILDSS